MTFTTLACGLTSTSQPTPVPIRQESVSPTTPVPGLTIDQVRNSQYQLGARDDHSVVQLTDGKYQHGTDTTTLDYASIMVSDFISIGDLTDDGVNEAAAVIYENYGGTGDFGFVAIYTNVNGLPVFLTSIIIDDRPMIQKIDIENGEVYLEAVVHGFDDPGCCPQLQTTRSYALINNGLHLTNYTTATSDGAKRIIEITSPINGSDITESVQVGGTISIAPFENNLSYFIYNEAGDQLAVGPVTVTASDFGAPGTFNEIISLAGIPAGTTISLEIQDQSAADGALLALDTVKLLVK